MSQVSASEHGPVCSRRGYADRGPATLFNVYTYTYACATRVTRNLVKKKEEKDKFLRALTLMRLIQSLKDYFMS